MNETSTDPISSPRSAKGWKTKQSILRAAAEVFVRDGYVASRVSDIAGAAGLSTGAFYRYFVDKRAVMIEVVRDFLERSDVYVRASPTTDPVSSVHTSTLRYLEFYRDNVGLWNVVYEACQADPEIERIRLDLVDLWIARIERTLMRDRDLGLVREDVDAELSSHLLGGLVSQYAYNHLSRGRGPTRDIEQIAAEIARIWSQATFVEPASQARAG